MRFAFSVLKTSSYCVVYFLFSFALTVNIVAGTLSRLMLADNLTCPVDFSAARRECLPTFNHFQEMKNWRTRFWNWHRPKTSPRTMSVTRTSDLVTFPEILALQVCIEL